MAVARVGKTHCPQGHPYDEANTRMYRGSRRCKACDREQKAAWYAAGNRPSNPPFVGSVEFFGARVIVSSSGCWDWQGTCDSAGYGRFRKWLAHRLSYEFHVGPIPPDRPDIDHTCFNRRCVNPLHLEAVTHQENVARSVRRRREAQRCE